MEIVKPSFKILACHDALYQIEEIARVCYKTESRSGTNTDKFIQKLISCRHSAMIEFADIIVKFVCDRGVSHELVRHRLCSFAQESTRYCDYSKSGSIQVICPPDIADENYLQFINLNERDPNWYSCFLAWYDSVIQAEKSYNYLRAQGVSPQIARSVLPTCLKTEIVVKANLREWRHIFKLRTPITAHPQMRELMIPLLTQLKIDVPIVFNDIEVV